MKNVLFIIPVVAIIAIGWILCDWLYSVSPILCFVLGIVLLIIIYFAKKQKKDNSLSCYMNMSEEERQKLIEKADNNYSWIIYTNINPKYRDAKLDECFQYFSNNWKLSPLMTLQKVSEAAGQAQDMTAGFYFNAMAYLNFYVFNSTQAAVMNGNMCMNILNITCKQDIIMPFYEWMYKDPSAYNLFFDLYGRRLFKQM